VKYGNISAIFVSFLQKNCFLQMNVLNDIAVIDYPKLLKRFVMVINLLSIKFTTKVFIVSNVDVNYMVGTLSQLFKNAM